MKVYPQMWRCPKHGLVGNCLHSVKSDGTVHDYCLECLVDALAAAGVPQVDAAE